MHKVKIELMRGQHLYDVIFAPGQLLLVNFYDLTDENFFSKERLKELGPEKVKELKLKSKIKVPGIIIRKCFHPEWPPFTVDLRIFSRWNDGEISGSIEIKDLCVWRYVDDVTQVPEWVLDSVKLAIEEGARSWCEVPISSIHYIEKDGEDYYKVFLFSPELKGGKKYENQ